MGSLNKLKDGYDKYNIINLNLKRIGINEDFVFCTHEKDLGLSKELEGNKFREPHNSKYLYDFVEKKDVVLDIGANLGYFALLCKKARKIICVEPFLPAVRLLKKNIEKNGLSNKCEVINAAVGNKKGKLFLEIHDAFNSSKIVKNENEKTLEVDVLSLKELVNKYKTNFLRLDLEGYEYELFLDNIPSRVDKISMEFHASMLKEEKIKTLFKYLDKEGFKTKYLITFFPKRLEKYYSFLKWTFLEKFFVTIFKNLSMEETFKMIKNNKGNFLIKLYVKYKLKRMRDCYIFLQR